MKLLRLILVGSLLAPCGLFAGADEKPPHLEATWTFDFKNVKSTIHVENKGTKPVVLCTHPLFKTIRIKDSEAGAFASLPIDAKDIPLLPENDAIVMPLVYVFQTEESIKRGKAPEGFGFDSRSLGGMTLGPGQGGQMQSGDLKNVFYPPHAVGVRCFFLYKNKLLMNPAAFKNVDGNKWVPLQ